MNPELSLGIWVFIVALIDLVFGPLLLVLRVLGGDG